MLEKGQSQSPGQKWNRIQISVPMCLFTRRSSVRRPCCSSRSSRPGTAALFLPEPTKRGRQLPCDFIYILATVQEASLHPRLVSSAVAALVFSGFLMWSDWFSQQFYLPLLARPVLILWHYYHMVLVVCFAAWRAGRKRKLSLICVDFAETG